MTPEQRAKSASRPGPGQPGKRADQGVLDGGRVLSKELAVEGRTADHGRVFQLLAFAVELYQDDQSLAPEMFQRRPKLIDAAPTLRQRFQALSGKEGVDGGEVVRRRHATSVDQMLRRFWRKLALLRNDP